jgi:hypothetical protein
MKSGKQRRTELQAKREAKQKKVERAVKEAEREIKLKALARGIAVNRSALAPDNSYSFPDFVERGFYVDIPFECRNCGKPQTWTATQQKWWYEVAKGGVWTKATLCRPCRQRERARQEDARRISQEGLERKRRKKS